MGANCHPTCCVYGTCIMDQREKVSSNSMCVQLPRCRHDWTPLLRPVRTKTGVTMQASSAVTLSRPPIAACSWLPALRRVESSCGIAQRDAALRSYGIVGTPMYVAIYKSMRQRKKSHGYKKYTQGHLICGRVTHFSQRIVKQTCTSRCMCREGDT